jgi:hypothetical protein
MKKTKHFFPSWPQLFLAPQEGAALILVISAAGLQGPEEKGAALFRHREK